MVLFNENITKHLDDEIRVSLCNNLFYIFISKIPLCLKETQKTPKAKLNGQRLNVMITLPERRLIDYET